MEETYFKFLIDVLSQCIKKHISVKEADSKLHISKRTIFRYLKRLFTSGPNGLKDKREQAITAR
jgi:hypothetical protein